MVVSATFDSNVYVSALNYAGIPRRIFELARTCQMRLDISNEIFAETARVLRDKFAWSDIRLDALKANLDSFANRVEPTEKLDVVKADPDDNKILECAVEAGSDYLVTGDKQVLKVGSHGKTVIVTPSEFLRILSQRGQDR